MTLFIWRILGLASAALFVVGVIILLCTRLLKNKYYREFHQDELLKKVKNSNSKNFIYLTTGETAKFVKKYVICKTAYERYLICNFTRKFKEISFYVVQYNSHKKVKKVLEVTQRDTTEASRVIALSRHCCYVNIVIGKVEGRELNFNVIRPLAMSRVRTHAAVKAFMLLLAMFVVRHVLIELFGGIYTLQYLASFLNYVTLGGMAVLSLLFYLVDVLCFRRKNIKKLNGGAIEYEFV